jgi:hypothetical protein
MSTLLAVYGAGGECLGRCDASCYDAEGNVCLCICGGRNHGAGLVQATENVRQMIEGIDPLLLDTGADTPTLVIHPVQLPLF